MGTKSDRNFPCLLCLSERFSEQQSHELQTRPESDYVFFTPAIGLKQHDARSLDPESQRGAFLKGHTGLSEDGDDLLSGNLSVGGC